MAFLYFSTEVLWAVGKNVVTLYYKAVYTHTRTHTLHPIPRLGQLPQNLAPLTSKEIALIYTH